MIIPWPVQWDFITPFDINLARVYAYEKDRDSDLSLVRRASMNLSENAFEEKKVSLAL